MHYEEQRFNEISILHSISNPPNAHLVATTKSCFLGSCFSTNISQKFGAHFISNFANPFGTQFSPDAIAQTIKLIENQEVPQLTQFENQFHALLFDSQFSNANSETLLFQIQQILAKSIEHIKKADTIFITLGSAWIYKHIETQKNVGNCHKIPQKNFEKMLLGISEIKKNIASIHKSLKNINPNCKIILTISPVRHLRDGIVENTISKSHLITATHEIMPTLNDCHYFPSFEIFNEELRDHRFFETDLAHPNQIAIDYIFQRLIETYAYPNLIQYFERAKNLSSLLSHKVKSTNELEISDWTIKRNQEIAKFKQEYPECTL